MVTSFFASLRLPSAAVLALAVTACGGGGGGGTSPAAPAVIDPGNAAVITREVLDIGLGAGAFGAALGSGGILAADEGNSARRGILRVSPLVPVGPESFLCLVSGSQTISGNLANLATVSPGDRITVDFDACNDGEDVVLDGRLRLDVNAFSGDDEFEPLLIDGQVSLTDLAVTGDGETLVGDGSFHLVIEGSLLLGMADLAVDGARLEVRSGTDQWVLRDFAVSVVEANDLVNPPTTTYTGTGTLEGTGFEGAVDFVTVVPLVATGNGYPVTGEVLIAGANGATIRATVLDAQTIQLAIDLDGDNLVDETQAMPWSTVGSLGYVVYGFTPLTRLP
jgi:hypothetical protein